MLWGHEDGEVTLGGRRVTVKRPPVRTADGESEVTLETYEHFSGRDPVGRLALERILDGVSTREYRRVQDPVERTREALWHLMSRQLADLRLSVLMLDGIEIKGRANVVALGITTEGDKLPFPAKAIGKRSTDSHDRRCDLEPCFRPVTTRQTNPGACQAQSEMSARARDFQVDARGQGVMSARRAGQVAPTL